MDIQPHAFTPSPGSTRCAVPGCGSPRLAMIHAVPEPDEPVPPFPAEPAFGSPEAVKQAAARLLRYEADMQDALDSMAEIPSDLRARLEESQDDVQRLISERDGLVTQLEGAGRALEGVKAEVERLRADVERLTSQRDAIGTRGNRLLAEQGVVCDTLADALERMVAEVQASIDTEEEARWASAGDCEIEAEHAHAVAALERINLEPARDALKLAGRPKS